MRLTSPLLYLLAGLTACASLDPYSVGPVDSDTPDPTDDEPSDDEPSDDEPTDDEPTDDDTSDGPTDDTGESDEPPPPDPVEAYVAIMQLIRYFSDYTRNGQHEILIGPFASTDPEDGTWEVVATNSDLYPLSEDGTWTPVFLDLGARLTAKRWDSFRLAFHYVGTNADVWHLDAICVSKVAEPVSTTDCDAALEQFDTTGIGGLPVGWWSREGAGNVSPEAWEVGSLYSFSGARSVSMTFDTQRTVDTYLVSPAVDVAP